MGKQTKAGGSRRQPETPLWRRLSSAALERIEQLQDDVVESQRELWELWGEFLQGLTRVLRLLR